MEHVIIVREHRGVCCCSRAGGCTLVALCPRGGRGEMADRTNEVELGAWRRGRVALGMLLDDFGTSIHRTFSAALYIYHPRPRPRVDEARLVVELVFSSGRSCGLSGSACSQIREAALFDVT